MHLSAWAPAQKIDEIGGNSSELNTPFLDGCPIQSPDGLSLYMASNRPGGKGGLDIWVVRGEPATGSYVSDDAARAFAELVGEDHVLTIDGGPHSPQRTHPEETVAAFIHALGPTAAV